MNYYSRLLTNDYPLAVTYGPNLLELTRAVVKPALI